MVAAMVRKSGWRRTRRTNRNGAGCLLLAAACCAAAALSRPFFRTKVVSTYNESGHPSGQSISGLKIPPNTGGILWCSGQESGGGKCNPSKMSKISISNNLTEFQSALGRALGSRRPFTDNEQNEIANGPASTMFKKSRPIMSSYGLLGHSHSLKPAAGDIWLEFGVAGGSSSNISQLLAGTASGWVTSDIAVHGFDTFTGLPEAWKGHMKKGMFDQGGILPPVESGVTLHKGLFNDTLQPFLIEHEADIIAGMNIDCDLYTGSIQILNQTHPFWMEGTILHFHEIQDKAHIHRSHHSTTQEEAVALHEFLLTHPRVLLELIPIQPQAQEPAVFVVLTTGSGPIKLVRPSQKKFKSDRS
mmetsp:Transcript_13582/g.39599  ORF Transcript_13582/g.39599 Transcript_13582/m.39599 type:complete len:359 (-) Transcript_13582:96-1172(-)